MILERVDLPKSAVRSAGSRGKAILGPKDAAAPFGFPADVRLILSEERIDVMQAGEPPEIVTRRIDYVTILKRETPRCERLS